MPLYMKFKYKTLYIRSHIACNNTYHIRYIKLLRINFGRYIWFHCHKGGKHLQILVKPIKLVTWALTLAPMMKDFLMSPTRNSKHRRPSLMQIHTLRENIMVLVRCLGRVSLANTTPTMKACNMTPVMLWMHITSTASGHSSVMYLEQERSCANERLAPKRKWATHLMPLRKQGARKVFKKCKQSIY